MKFPSRKSSTDHLLPCMMDEILVPFAKIPDASQSQPMMKGCAIEDLKSVDDLMTVMDIAEDLGVDLEGLNEVEPMVERLILHKLKITGQKYFNWEKAGLDGTNFEHKKKIRATSDVFNKVRSSLSPCLQSVNTILKAGAITNDLDSEFKQRLFDLENQECCIVFSGETSAGKSSLLNLLLGVEILPTHIMSCTFLICKIKYRPTYGTKVIYHNGTTECSNFDSPRDARSYLNRVVFERGGRTREENSKIREIEIYVPAEILKSGVTIVDTPGFGENAHLNQMVLNVLATSNISAFVYLIKSDNAGGVQEDRLLDFLREFRKKRKTSSIREESHSTAAMFICNRWDIVQDCHKEKVRQNALSKLEDAWPDFKKSQTIFFSTEKAGKHFYLDADYISEDFAHLLQMMVKLSKTALDNSIKQHYRWLRKVLSQTSNHVLSMVRQLNKTDEELEEKFTEAKRKIDSLQTSARETVSDLKQLIEEESQSLADNIKSFLDDNECKTRILNWECDPELNYLRRSSALSLASTLKTDKQFKYDSIALRKLLDEVDQWIRERDYSEKLRRKVEARLSRDLLELYDDITLINRDMNDNSSLSSFSTSTSSLPDDDLYALMDELNRSHSASLASRIEHIADQRGITNMLQPKVIVARLLLSAIQSIQERRRASALDSNPNKYVIERGLRFRATLQNNRSLLKTICARYTETLSQRVACIEESIPKFIRSTQELIQEIKRARSLQAEDKSSYTDTLGHLETARTLFRGYSITYISDIRSDSLNIELDSATSLSSSTREALESSLNDSTTGSFSHNVCFSSQVGVANIHGEDCPFTSRINTTEPPEKTLFEEAVKLRCMKHKNVAELLGVVRYTGQSLLLFRGSLRPLTRYIKNPCLADVGNKTSRMIGGILKGLEYLHRDGLVHMELTIKTIMVDPELDQVKLIGACLPRKVDISRDSDTAQIGRLVCLSPDVLRGNIYTQADDIYGLGLIIWELLMQKCPFAAQMGMTTKEFVETVDPVSMVTTFPDGLEDVLSSCIHTSRDRRATIEDVVPCFREVDLDPLVSTLKLSRRGVVRKSRSSPALRRSAFQKTHSSKSLS